MAASPAVIRTSSWIEADIYDPDTNTLYIATKTGKAYACAGVDAAQYREYDAAPSQGVAFNAQFRQLANVEISIDEFRRMQVDATPVGKGKRRKSKTNRIFRLRVPGRYVSPQALW
jgi:hypothetical protein